MQEEKTFLRRSLHDISGRLRSGKIFISWLRTDEIRILGTNIAVSQIISASLFVGFGLIVIIRRSMAKKRADMRRRRREKVYEEEERMEAELARADAEDEAKNSGSESNTAPEEAGSEHPQQEGPAEEPGTEPGTDRMMNLYQRLQQ